MLIQTIVILSVFAAAFSTPTTGGRIVNGTDAQLGEIPFIVSLRSYNSHSCGGSILTPRHVVTAAHCVQGSLPVSLSVQYGLIDIIQTANAPNVIVVEQVFIHANYSPAKAYIFDVAVLKLRAEIPFSTNIQPILLPSAFNATPANLPALLSGWGYPYSGGSVMTKLQKVNIIVYSDDDCELIHANTGPTNRFNHICAGIPEGGKGQCSGDSGGPLVVNNRLVGLVSWSVKPCTRRGYPGVFTKVSNLVAWINEQIAK